MAGIDLIVRYNSPRRVRTGARNTEPLWGCDRVDVGKLAFVPVRMHPATECGCDPLAAGPFAGADALRPVSQMSIAAFRASSRTGASRTESGAHPAREALAPPPAGAPHCSLRRVRSHSPRLFIRVHARSSNTIGPTSAQLNLVT